MNSVLLLEAIGQLDEDLLERSENASGKKNTVRRMIQWAALAACLCIVLTWGSQFLSMGSKKADLSNGENDIIEKPQAAEPGETLTENEEGNGELAFTASAIQTQGEESADYPQVFVMNSWEELNTYTEANRKHLEYSEFITVIQNYDAAYFAEKQLILLVLKEDLGSGIPEVSHITRDVLTGEVTVTVPRNASAQQTGEPVFWHIPVEVQRGLVMQEQVILKFN